MFSYIRIAKTFILPAGEAAVCFVAGLSDTSKKTFDKLCLYIPNLNIATRTLRFGSDTQAGGAAAGEGGTLTH